MGPSFAPSPALPDPFHYTQFRAAPEGGRLAKRFGGGSDSLGGIGSPGQGAQSPGTAPLVVPPSDQDGSTPDSQQ